MCRLHQMAIFLRQMLLQRHNGSIITLTTSLTLLISYILSRVKKTVQSEKSEREANV